MGVGFEIGVVDVSELEVVAEADEVVRLLAPPGCAKLGTGGVSDVRRLIGMGGGGIEVCECGCGGNDNPDMCDCVRE